MPERFSGKLKFQVDENPYEVEASVRQAEEDEKSRLNIDVKSNQGFSISLNLPFSMEGIKSALEGISREITIERARTIKEQLDVLLEIAEQR